MTKEQKYLLDKHLDDVVLNSKQYPENTPENAKHWIYLSDVLKQYYESELNKLSLTRVSKNETVLKRCKCEVPDPVAVKTCLKCFSVAH